MSKPIYDDPVVAEIHRIRAEMLAEYGGDFDKLMAKVREDQANSEIVILKAPRRGGGTVTEIVETDSFSPPTESDQTSG